VILVEMSTVLKDMNKLIAIRRGDDKVHIRLFSEGKKTHRLRKVYVAMAYAFYSDKSMKEIAFAQRVLGHESVNVSLLYTSIRIDTGVDDVGGYNEHMER